MKLFSKAEKMPETLAELEEMLPDLVAQARTEGAASVDVASILAARDAAHVESLESERSRSLAIAEKAFGAEASAKFSAVLSSGITADQFSALFPSGLIEARSSSGEEAFRSRMLDAITAAGPGNPGTDTAGSASDLPEEQRARAAWDRDPDLRAGYGDDFAAYEAFLAAEKAGKVRIFTGKTIKDDRKGGN